MNKLYDQINLTIQSGEYHLKAFTGDDVGLVRFQEDQSLLPADGKWEKVQACVNGNLINGYLDVSDLKFTKEISLIESEDEVENTRKINELALQNLAISSEKKMFLSSLMHLGINYDEYQINRESIANKFFKGESLLYKLDDYYIKDYFAKNYQEREIIKILACDLISTISLDSQPTNNRIEFIRIMSNLPKRVLNDKNLMLAAVSRNGFVLNFASEELKADKDVVLAAVSQNGSVLDFASEELKADRDVVLAAVSQNGSVLGFASKELKAEENIVFVAVSQNGSVLEYASEELKAKENIVLAAVSKRGEVLEYASEELKAKENIVLAAVSQNGFAIIYASKELKAKKNIVLAAVSQKGSVLQYVSKEFRADRDVVLAAVSQNGESLQYASKYLQSDKDIVLAAVSQNGLAIYNASKYLQSDKDVVLAMLMQFSSKKILDINPNAVSTLSKIRSDDFQISIDEVNKLVQGYEKFKRDRYIFNDDADRYIKDLINNKGLRASKACIHILNRIIKDKSIIRDKEKYFLEIISHLELEAFCLKTIGLTEPKILRIILPMFKQILNHRNKKIKKYFSGIFKMDLKNRLKDFFENLVFISGGMVDLILPSILLSKLDVSISLKKDIFEILKNKNKFFKDKNNPLLQSLIILEEKLIVNRPYIPTLNDEKIVEIIKAIFVEDVIEVIKRINLISIIAKTSPIEIESIDDFSSSNLFKLVIKKLVESGILEYTKELQDKFNETFMKSRIPYAIFTYAGNFINNSEMMSVIKRFIDGVLYNTYLTDRHNNNSHKYLLSEAQKLEWEKGEICDLDSFGLKEIKLDPLLFLTTTLITNNHGGGKLERLKEVISSASAISKPNEVEFLCIELLSKVDSKEQLAILKRLQIALSTEEYIGIEFVNDIKYQITLMENPSEFRDDLVIHDTEDWQDLFLCGTEVLGNCQRIDGDPDYNRCLLGYVLDGKIRMIKISSKDGVTIASSIIKIMKTTFDEPALFLERIYPDFRYEKEIIEFALKRAKSLGISAFECVRGRCQSVKLISKRNTALYEYSDSFEPEVKGVTNGTFFVEAMLL